MVAGAKAVEGAKHDVAEAKEDRGGAAAAEKPETTEKKEEEKPAEEKAVAPAAHDDAGQIDKVSKGLGMLAKLKGLFAKDQGASEMAEGAMTAELSKKDSTVWATIMDMVKTTQEVGSKLKNSKLSKAEKDALMKSVEDKLNAKADSLGGFTQQVDKTDERHSEEYLLGLLMQHQGTWNSTKQLDVLKGFSKALPIARELLERQEEAKKPLAVQLGDLMDKEKAKKASKVFLQLASSLHEDPDQENVEEKIDKLGPVLDKLRSLDPKAFGGISGLINKAQEDATTSSSSSEDQGSLLPSRFGR